MHVEDAIRTIARSVNDSLETSVSEYGWRPATPDSEPFGHVAVLRDGEFRIDSGWWLPVLAINATVTVEGKHEVNAVNSTVNIAGGAPVICAVDSKIYDYRHGDGARGSLVIAIEGDSCAVARGAVDATVDNGATLMLYPQIISGDYGSTTVWSEGGTVSCVDRRDDVTVSSSGGRVRLSGCRGVNIIASPSFIHNIVRVETHGDDDRPVWHLGTAAGGWVDSRGNRVTIGNDATIRLDSPNSLSVVY